MITALHRGGPVNDHGIPRYYIIRNIISIDSTQKQVYFSVGKKNLGGGVSK